MINKVLVLNAHEWEKIVEECLFDEVPESWEIWNAARPIPGHKDWTGEFRCGVFYVGIDPDADYADEYRERCQSLDAYLCVKVPRAEVESWGREFCELHDVNYDDFDFSVIVKSWYNHQED
jgi:hypothetical protein